MSSSLVIWQSGLVLAPALAACLGGFWVFRSRRSSSLIIAAQLTTLGVLIALAVAGLFFELPGWFCLLPLALALPYAFHLVANLSVAKTVVRGIVRQRRWDLALLGLSPLLLAGGYWQVVAFTATEPFDLINGVPQHYNRQKATEVAYTDRQRTIPLFELNQASRENFSIPGDEGLILTGTPMPYRAIRLSEASGDSNCIGWVFCGGQYEMQCQDVPTILEDNGYSQVKTPQLGDLILYRDENNAINHVGTIALFLHGEQPFIESKWGLQGVFLHLPEGSPFGSNWTYFRSSRPNKHLLTRASAPLPAPDFDQSVP
ncbi:hypothetical protein BH10PLA2_BH10PLA2_34940 [soil metagenome]